MTSEDSNQVTPAGDHCPQKHSSSRCEQEHLYLVSISVPGVFCRARGQAMLAGAFLPRCQNGSLEHCRGSPHLPPAKALGLSQRQRLPPRSGSPLAVSLLDGAAQGGLGWAGSSCGNARLNKRGGPNGVFTFRMGPRGGGAAPLGATTEAAVGCGITPSLLSRLPTSRSRRL